MTAAEDMTDHPCWKPSAGGSTEAHHCLDVTDEWAECRAKVRDEIAGKGAPKCPACRDRVNRRAREDRG